MYRFTITSRRLVFPAMRRTFGAVRHIGCLYITRGSNMNGNDAKNTDPRDVVSAEAQQAASSLVGGGGI